MPGAFTGSMTLVAVLSLIALGSAIYIYWKYLFNFREITKIRILFLAGALAITNVIVTVISSFVYSEPGIIGRAIFINLSMGFLIGFGLGLGIEMAAYLIGRKVNLSHTDKE
jgi:hypothetical protein